MTLLDALQQSFEFAQALPEMSRTLVIQICSDMANDKISFTLEEFNRQIELRQALKRLGFMKEVPST